MFQIKTDIREYECDSHEKVERLIRNWVIRPADLIFIDEEQSWEPIGENPAFVSLFRELDEEESKFADTVVTTERPGPGSSGVVWPAPPPSAPEGVEGVLRDSDEITMMTDETFDLLREGVEEADPGEEVTHVVKLAEDASSPDGDGADGEGRGVEEEATAVIHRDEVEGAPDEGVDVEADTAVIHRDEVAGATGTGEDEPEREESGEDEAESEDAEALGRHGLPEDIFATNELTSWTRSGDRLDELGEHERSEEEWAEDEQKVAEGNPGPQEELRKTDQMTESEIDALMAKGRVERGEKSEGGTTDEGELDDLLEGAAELVGAEASDEESVMPAARRRERQVTPTGEMKVPSMASGGYELELPIPVGPSREDLEFGISSGQVDEATKDATFPYPKFKTPGEVEVRRFGFEDGLGVAQRPLKVRSKGREPSGEQVVASVGSTSEKAASEGGPSEAKSTWTVVFVVGFLLAVGLVISLMR